MKAIIQRVNRAQVKINGDVFSQISKGLLVFLGIAQKDKETHADKLLEKILNMRIFSNELGKFDKSILDINAELMIVSQFTLCADISRGRRPDFTEAQKPEKAKELYEYFVKISKLKIPSVKTGLFAHEMKIELENDGPVTIIAEINPQE